MVLPISDVVCMECEALYCYSWTVNYITWKRFMKKVSVCDHFPCHVPYDLCICVRTVCLPIDDKLFYLIQC